MRQGALLVASLALVAWLILFLTKSKTLMTMKPSVTPLSTDELRSRWGPMASLLSRVFSIPSVRILAHITQESYGDQLARGPVGEIGLMQLTKGTFNETIRQYPGFNYTWPEDMKDGSKNIRIGVAYLKILLDRWGDLDRASEAYNAGRPGTAAGAKYLALIKKREKLFQ
jgi:soluble lytic murein transglycosylase-like protein